MVFPFEDLPATTQIEQITLMLNEAGIKHIVWTGSVLRLYGVERTELHLPHYLEFVVEDASLPLAVQVLYERGFSRGLTQTCGRSVGPDNVGTELIHLTTGGRHHLDLLLHAYSKVIGRQEETVPEPESPMWMSGEDQGSLPSMVLSELPLLKPVFYIQMHLLQWARRWCLGPEESYHWFMGARVLDHLISQNVKPEVVGYELCEPLMNGVWRAVHNREAFDEVDMYVQRMAQALIREDLLIPLRAPHWPEQMVREVDGGGLVAAGLHGSARYSTAGTFGDSYYDTIANTSVEDTGSAVTTEPTSSVAAERAGQDNHNPTATTNIGDDPVARGAAVQVPRSREQVAAPQPIVDDGAGEPFVPETPPKEEPMPERAADDSPAQTRVADDADTPVAASTPTAKTPESSDAKDEEDANGKTPTGHPPTEAEAHPVLPAASLSHNSLPATESCSGVAVTTPEDTSMIDAELCQSCRKDRDCADCGRLADE
ncbi:uncharacterized protein BP01DRAFT_362236 [Aspergillus saccharolyticus JOP 1030-1]|uniref:Uncharacterized protein n=1 Tax=Aspergillus saccharolyticus JOP 1030-1 TaxID=1450539 RepID=A0A318ZNT1_9EURO|nr:hypothetical protein BP01DRAFT_362236 [Aspergillus saccharolyticus JOP 1030-1]PYH49281.1 hypothetical protein BP01DRAFT_362236 [Aspergillus saccharolyticus JOP 1030-1]